VLFEPGQVLSAGALTLLAACGMANVVAGGRPRVALLATGSELKEAGQSLAPGQIFESNRAGLAALVRKAEGIPRVFPIVADDLRATRLVLRLALDECDIVVTCGGVSVGEMDFVKKAFEESGGQLNFWRVAMKPGRPFAFGRSGEKLFFGLPGNPVSAFVTFLLLVRPALKRWQGAVDVSLPAHAGLLAEALGNPGDRRHFIRVKVDPHGNIYSAGEQASHLQGCLAASNGLVDLPPRTSLPAGATVQVLRWE
jgi:molybdopterin molybdotransferase